MTNLSGILPAILTPLHEDETFNEKAFGHARANGWPQAVAVQDRINRLIRILLSVPIIPAVKQIMTWRGIPCGPAAGPRRALTGDEAIWLRTQLEQWEAS